MFYICCLFQTTERNFYIAHIRRASYYIFHSHCNHNNNRTWLNVIFYISHADIFFKFPIQNKKRKFVVIEMRLSHSNTVLCSDLTLLFNKWIEIDFDDDERTFSLTIILCLAMPHVRLFPNAIISIATNTLHFTNSEQCKSFAKVVRLIEL